MLGKVNSVVLSRTFIVVERFRVISLQEKLQEISLSPTFTFIY
jgi:hypothetical protein